MLLFENGSIQKVCHLPREEQNSEQNRKGEWVKPKSDVTNKKYNFNNRIRMTFEIIITPLHLLTNLVFHVDNTV